MTVGLAISNFVTGFSTNPQTAYLASPQTLSPEGLIQGHVFFVIEQIPRPKPFPTDLPSNPLSFVFGKTSADVAIDGVLTTVVPGLPAGFFKMSSILTSSNHLPVLLPIIQHGAVDDVIFVTRLFFRHSPCYSFILLVHHSARWKHAHQRDVNNG
jgi:hypothetical protein